MKISIKYFAAITIVLFITSCATVPITGRKQLKVIPNSMMLSMGQSNYATFLTQNPAVSPPTNASLEVSVVGKNISRAVESYLSSNNMSSAIEGYKWEFNTVNSPEVNAWCMPGGKVVVYSGLLPITKDDDGLAVVLGHEIAHAVANHGNERMSQQLAIQLGGISLALAMQQKPELTQQIFLAAYGVGSQLGTLAYSRQHELEADKLGLIFMAMAGYNPERALSFWKNMAASSTGSKPLELLSTHPSDSHRIAEIEKFLPEAMKYYNPNASNTNTSTNSNPNTNTNKPIQIKPIQNTNNSTPNTPKPTQNTPAPPSPKKLGVKIK